MGKGKKLHPREKKVKLKKIEKLQLSLLLCKGTNASKIQAITISTRTSDTQEDMLP